LERVDAAAAAEPDPVPDPAAAGKSASPKRSEGWPDFEYSPDQKPFKSVGYEQREAANRKLGRAGEEYVLEEERTKLQDAGREDLLDRVVWVADELGDGAGYDIESCDLEGEPIYIEVKTTRRGSSASFLVTRNEVAASEYHGDAYRLYRVYDFGKSTRYFELKGPLGECCHLRPDTLKAKV
jgi:hypothetical protein